MLTPYATAQPTVPRAGRRLMVSRWPAAVILALVVGLILLSGPATARRVKLTVALPGGPDVFPAGLVESFQAKHPDIEVETVIGGWGEILDKIPVQAAAGTAPDVFYGESGRAMEWGFNGLVEDLRPYIRRDLRVSDYFFLNAAQDPAGPVWGIPGGFQVTTMFYNTALFDQAGLVYPDNSWTIEDLVNAARKLTRREGDKIVQYGFNLQPNYGTVGWLLWIHLLGGTVFDETRRIALFASPSTIQAIDFMVGLMYRDNISPKPSESGFSFRTGNVGMEFNIYINSHYIRQANLYSYDLAVIPAGPGGRRYTTVVPNVWMMNRQTTPERKEAAWEFIKYYVSQEIQEKVVRKGSEVPVTRAAARAFLDQPPPPRNRQSVLDSFAFAQTLDENAAWRQWWGVVPRELAGAFSGTESAVSAATRVQQALQTILNAVYGTKR